MRATAQAELKKKEKDIERMAEKWQKLSDAQLKLTPSGMRCANAAVVDGSEVLGKGQGFLEVALEQAEQAREQLGVENLHLRKLVLKAVNEMQLVLHKARSCLSEKEIEEVSGLLLSLYLDESELGFLARPVHAHDAVPNVTGDYGR